MDEAGDFVLAVVINVVRHVEDGGTVRAGTGAPRLGRRKCS